MTISVTGFTAARSQAIEDNSIVDGSVNSSGDLLLVKHNGAVINAGNVTGPQGPTGSGNIVCTSTTRPGSPSQGDTIWETDTKRIYVWTGGSWRWIWSQNGEDKIRVAIDVTTNNDVDGPKTWPTGLEASIAVPPWAKRIEGFALLGQAQQVNAQSNTELQILIGARIIAHKRIRWQILAPDNERDIMLMGDADVSDMVNSTQLFRVKGDRLSGLGALRLDSESVCYITGRFTDT